MKIVDHPRQAVASISSFQRVFVHGGAATPLILLDALYDRAHELTEVEWIHLHLMGDVPHGRKCFTQAFRAANLFVGPNVRRYMDYEYIDYLPCFLSEIPALFYSKKRAPHVALIHVSPPDKHGYCTLGTSVDIAKAATDTADLVIAQINPQMPRVHGDGFIHVRDIDIGIEVDIPVLEEETPDPSAVEKKIAEHVVSLIEDGSTLQVGIGKMPSAVLSQLGSHRHLGIHTEVCSDAMLPLIQSGVIDNLYKKIHPGKIVSAFAIGTRKLYDFLDDNMSVALLHVAYTNHPEIIGRNEKVVAINSAVEIDLTGQICADSIGPKVISGVGGQIDFMRGAMLSKGGKSILALPSRTDRGQSKIVSALKQGAGVVTTRAHIYYVVSNSR